MTGEAMTSDLDAIVELRKAAKEGEWYPLLLSDEDARFLRAVTSFDFDALQSRLAVLEGALDEARGHVQTAYEWHLEGTRPTGQSIELGEALRVIRAALTPDPGSEERTDD